MSLQSTSNHPPQRMQVLVVDDNSDSAALIAELLGELGHDVRVAHTGPGALAVFETGSPEVVFLDLGLPQMNGFEVARAIRTRHGKEVRIIALTGFSGSAEREEAREAGFDAFAVKPVHPTQLKELLGPAPAARIEDLPQTAIPEFLPRGDRDEESGKLLILVVERDPHIRELEAHFLKQAGYSIEFAANGLAALEQARRLLPDVVITEILVPKLDGLALCRQLKADPLTRGISVLVFSILAASARAKEAGADAFLTKPLAEHRLVGMVQSLLEERSRLRNQES